jgi:glycine oxidase
MSHVLLSRGHSVMVIDNAHPRSASRVAAGMYNPISFKRLNLAWNTVKVLPRAEEMYPEIEEKLGGRFMFPFPIRRHFPNNENHEQFLIKQDLPLYKPYLGDTDDDGEFGSGVVHGGGFVNLRTLLPAYRSMLESAGSFLEMEVSDDDIVVTETGVEIGEVSTSALIFCRGIADVKSKWWCHLPLKESKGELITVKAEGLAEDKIHNNGKFALPLGENLFRTGSTYTWNDLNEDPTPEGKKEVLDKFEKLHQGPYEVTEHIAGIRPTVKDRQPLVGAHLDQKNFSILNGLGTRGVLIGPWCAEQLADFLLENQPLVREIDVRRFK